MEILSSDRKLVDLLPSPVQNSDIHELSEKLVKLKSVTVALQGEDIDLCDARALFDEILEEYKEPEFKRYLDKKAQIVHCKAFDNAVVKCLSGNLETMSAEELVALVPLQIQAKQILPPSEKTTKSSEDFGTSIIKKRRTENRQATNQQKYLDARFLVPTADKLERFFSSAGIAFNDFRQSLLPVNLEMQLFVKTNREYWNEETVLRVINEATKYGSPAEGVEDYGDDDDCLAVN